MICQTEWLHYVKYLIRIWSWSTNRYVSIKCYLIPNLWNKLLFSISPWLLINKIWSAPVYKHLGLILDCKLDFNQHIDDKTNRCSKIIKLMKRLTRTLSRKSILATYKSFVRPILDYADFTYDEPVNESFKRKLEVMQYKWP